MPDKIDIFDVSFQTECYDSIEKRQSKKDAKDIQKLAEKFMNDRTEKSFNALVKRCDWGLKSFVGSMTGNRYDTDSAISVTLERVWFNINTYNPETAKFSTWLYTIAYNTTIQYLKNKGVNNKLNVVSVDVSDMYHDSSDDEENINIYNSDPYEFMSENMYFNGKCIVPITKNEIKSEIYDASVECIEYLPDHLRIVMKERYVNKKNARQIAEDNNMTLFSVQNWLLKGKRCLSDEVKFRYPDLYDIYCETFND